MHKRELRSFRWRLAVTSIVLLSLMASIIYDFKQSFVVAPLGV